MSDKFTYLWGYELLRALPVKSAVQVEVGDHVKLSGGSVTPITAVADNLTMIAVAKEAHPSSGKEAFSGEITCAIRNAQAIYEVDLDAATDMIPGDTLQLVAADKQQLSKNTTDPVAVCMEGKLQATAIRVIYTMPATTGGLNFIGDAS